MKVGTARFCLTPKQLFYLIGYRSENRYEPATGVHDDIYANSLLFEENGKELFIFSADFLEFEEEMAEEVKTLLHDRYGIDRDAVLLSATHNHSSIVSYHRGWYTGKFDEQYYEYLLDIIMNSYELCKKNAREATARYGKKVVLGYYGNRNHPGKPADNEIIVVKFYNSADKCFAGFVNWAVHSTVISAENTELTSELAGEVSKKLFDEFGCYPAMLVGAAGDCSNRNERKGNDFQELERVSTALAKEIAEIPTDEEVLLTRIKIQTLYHTIHHNMELEETPFHLDAKGAVIDLGGLQFFVFPGELGSVFGIEMKGACKSLGIILGYTNGYYEYFMNQEEYGLSFETIGCKIPKGEPEKLVEKYIQTSDLLARS
ncbi:neutral/alkaline non-lysosomal ceramidase N-terminal domain-containing protein [Konateibacter massiliensis]|uniref:neutral/alkaline non-lysosomal ceramidase N-terminal domain-containing protein n=1 Tax=Konateibacter massiliensis TaxID=2002841 RepID=UPI000C150CAF|nr:neutral/alkaline non-lysosomal ceramidase N-terminal domain-containing protein [Konateibacter massiliensis]